MTIEQINQLVKYRKELYILWRTGDIEGYKKDKMMLEIVALDEILSSDEAFKVRAIEFSKERFKDVKAKPVIRLYNRTTGKIRVFSTVVGACEGLNIDHNKMRKTRGYREKIKHNFFSIKSKDKTIFVCQFI